VEEAVGGRKCEVLAKYILEFGADAAKRALKCGLEVVIIAPIAE